MTLPTTLLPHGKGLLIRSVLLTSLLVGAALAAPEIAVSGKTLPIADGDGTPRIDDNSDFGITTASSGIVKRVFVIANTGSTSLNVIEVSVDAPQFSITALPQNSVPKDGVSSFEVTYEPLTAGVHNATVTISNDDSDENPYTFAIRGTAKAPEIQVQGLGGLNVNTGDTTPNSEDGTDYGTRTLRQVVEREFTIINDGEVDMEIQAIGISAGPFTISQQPSSTIAPGSNSKFTIRYNPVDAGSRIATVTILSNDLDESTYTFVVRGNANEPEIAVYCNAVLINASDLSPSADDGTLFDPISFRSSKPSKSFLVRNTGGGALMSSSVTLSDAVNFVITSPLPEFIAPGAHSTLVVEYNPPASGTHNCIITINNNDLDEAPYVFAIRASSIVPTSNWGRLTNGDTSPSPAEETDFGIGVIGAPPVIRNYPISNGGPGTLVISAINIQPGNHFALPIGVVFPISVAPGTSYQLPVQFNPAAIGQHTATVTVANNDPVNNPFAFDVTGLGASRRAVVGNPSMPIIDGDTTPSPGDGTDFGTVIQGATPIKTATIPVKNDGSVALTISNIVLSDNVNFRVMNDPLGSIAPGAKVDVVIGFDPQSGGLKTTGVSIISDDPTSPFDFTMQGYSRSVIDFGSTVVAAPPITRNYTVANQTNAPMQVNSITMVPAAQYAYAGPTPPFTIAPNQSVQLPFRYTPTENGRHETTVTVRTGGDNPQYPLSFILRGSADKRLVEVGNGGFIIPPGDTTPSTAEGTVFGNVIVGVGAQVSRSWTVRNNGNVPLTINSAVLSNTVDFILQSNPSGTLAPGATANLSVIFSPRSAILHTATLTINSDDPRTPFVFTIQGDGRPRIESDNPYNDNPTLTPIPWDPNRAGPYAGLIGTPDANGRITAPFVGGFDVFNINPNGAFTASGTFLDQPLTIKGQLGPNGRYQGTHILPDGSNATFDLQLQNGADGSSRIVGTLKHLGKTWIVEVIRGLTGNIPNNMIGKYTFVIPADEKALDGQPSGDGVGTSILRIDGRMMVKARLGDRNAFTMKGFLVPRYQWIIYKRVYKRGGNLVGKVQFRDVPNISDFDGTLQWTKRQAGGDLYYPAGFDVTRKIVGNYFTVPPRGTSCIRDLIHHTGEPNSVFQIGSSAEGVPVNPKLMTWTPLNTVLYKGPDIVKMKISTKDGRITGQYKDANSTSYVNIDGVVMQKQNRAGGLVYGHSITGYISILPRQYTGF